MQVSEFLLLLIGFGLLFFAIQRAESKRRLLVAVIMLIPGLLLQRFANYRGLHTEALTAFVLALVLNFLFWALIGRYNPPGSSDEIKVIGMDDEIEPKVPLKEPKKRRH